MAFSSGNKGPSSSLSEINVTPLVDVMLVLLIIFMISAPLLQSGVELDLPKGNNEMEAAENAVILSINAEGKHFFNDTYLKPEVILEKLKQAGPKQAVYLRGDKTIPYGIILEFLSYLRENGIQQVSLITDPTPQKQAK